MEVKFGLVRAAEAAMSPRKKSSPKPAKSRGGPFLLRLLLIVIVVAVLFAFLPAPWAVDIGGHFSAMGEWDGYGPVQASNGGSDILFTHLHGGITNGDAAACTIHGCEALTGSADPRQVPWNTTTQRCGSALGVPPVRLMSVGAPLVLNRPCTAPPRPKV